MKGVMLDCSRNAVMNVKTVKKFITYLKKTGYDALMLYTEDTYEIKEEPLFGYMRGRYSQEELKEIVSFGDFSGVEVIPCIQTLAHLNAIFNYPRFLKIRDVNDILLVDEEETYKLIEEMFVACENCFSSRRIHIGMDEAHMLGLGRYLDAHGFDVQEIRVGGLLQRLKSCKERLTLYLDGKVDEIEELNEKLVDFVTGKKPEGKLRVSYSYCRMATPNPL